MYFYSCGFSVRPFLKVVLLHCLRSLLVITITKMQEKTIMERG